MASVHEAVSAAAASTSDWPAAAMLASVTEAVSVTWVLLASLAAMTVYSSRAVIWPHYAGRNIPPFPVPRRPGLGHLHLMWGNTVETLGTFQKKAGNIFSLDLAGRLLVVFSGYENIRDILIKHTGSAGERPQDPSSKYLGEDNHGFLTSRGENWKEQRATAMTILRAFGMGKNTLAHKIQEEAVAFNDKLASFKGKAMTLQPVSSAAVSNVTCAIIVGKRFDYDDPFFQTMTKNVNYMFAKFPKAGLLETFPFLPYLPGDPVGIKKWAAHVYDLNENFVKAYISQVKATFNPDEEPDNFISAYLREMHNKKKNGEPTRLDDANLVSNIKSLFAAGTESTSSTIIFCVLYSLHHPRIQDKIYQEILTHVGTERVPNIDDRPKLRYLEAVIRETHRFASVNPVLMRTATEDFNVRGYTVPKGSDIMLYISSVHFDPAIWGDPHEFRPERFLDEDGQLRKTDELIPFSVGRRDCVAAAMAKIVLYLFLSHLFQRFTVEPEDASSELPSLEPIIGQGASPQFFNVRFVQRRPQ